jgi:hypothetical protein
MAAAGAIWRRHLPDGGIQWLPVKPWTCSIGLCAPRSMAASAWHIRSSIMSHITFIMCQFVLIVHLRDYHFDFDLDIVVL